MKFFTRYLLFTGLFLLCGCLFLTACKNGGNTPAQTDSEQTGGPTESTDTAEEATMPVTEIVTETITENVTDTGESEDITEPETAPPSLMNVVDMDLLDGRNSASYFNRANKCDVTLVDDETEGKVVRLTTVGLSQISTAMPTVYFKMADLVESAGGIMPSTVEYPYLLLKVRAVNLWSHNFGLLGGTSTRELDTSAIPQNARLDMTDNWQYICFDLTGYEQDLMVFYLCYEFVTAGTGETLDIAEARLVATKEEAFALAGENTYPITDRTMEDYTLKVISYNIWAGAIPDWEIRADIFSDFIDTYRPDSIGMQEVSIKWRSLLDSHVFNESYAGVGELRIPGAEYDAIYYRKDKFDLIETDTFWLSDTPDVMGSTHPEANAERICTWARLRDKQTGFEYVHVNTHLDHRGNNEAAQARSIRLFQARVILEFISKLGDVPVVFTGDFNQATTNSKDADYPLHKNITGISSFKGSDGSDIQVFLGNARDDASDTVSSDSWASMVKYHEEGSDAFNPAHKPIDHIYYSTAHFDAVVYRNIYHPRDGYSTSDHVPQYTELRVKIAAK